MKELLDQLYSGKYTEKRLIDLFIPEGNENGACILFIHGGGWVKGARTQWHPVARYFCEKGYFCASTGYRLAPEWTYPGQVEDVRLAMDFIRRNASKFNFDPQKIAAAGSSAGGHLVGMLATIPEGDKLGYSDEMSGLDTKPNAAICYCTVTNLHSRDLNPDSFVTKFIGRKEAEAPETYAEASPYMRLKGNEPPFLFIHGECDDIVDISQAEEMCNRINSLGGASELVKLTGVKHGFGYGVTTPAQKTSIENVERFLKNCFNIANEL